MISGPMPSSGTGSAASPLRLRLAFSLRIVSFSAASAAQSASSSALSEPKCRARILRHLLADAGNAEREDEARQRPCRANCWMLSMTFCADFSAIRSRPASDALSSRGRGPPDSRPCRGRPAARPASRPAPSMSIARRPTKCSSACLRCALQYRPPVQRATASPSSRTTGDSQTGQRLRHARSGLPRAAAPRTARAPLRESRRRPAARPRCRRPSTSLRRSSSSLCSVALVTVTPPTNTGFRRATGVSAPVRPTWTSISSTSVICSSAGYLCAIAKRGARETKPSCSCQSRRFTL